jgi:sRNA-binding protein
MVSTGFSVLKVDYANDSIWDDAVVALIAVHPMVEGDDEDDHIAVIMNAKLCHHTCCAGANDKDMQFTSGFAEEAEDVVFAFRDVNSQKMRVNRELKGKTAEKRPKRPRAKKVDATVGTQETDETVETEESSKKKGRRKAPESDATTSDASGEKVPKSKKAPKKLTL